MKKQLIRFWTAGALFFAAAPFAEAQEHEGHDHAHAEHAHEAPPEKDDHAAHDAAPEEAGLETARGGRIQRIAVFPAEVMVNRDVAAAVSPRYAGTIQKLHVEIGDRVESGDVLATIENSETFSVYSVVSPLTGTVVSRNQSIGERVGEESVLFDVVDLSTVWVEVHIFPQYLHAVEKGQPVRLVAADGHAVETEIDYVSPLIDPATRTVKARCVLQDAGADFFPGAFVRAETAVETVDARVRVAADAVQRMNGEAIVFVEDEHGIEPRDVTTGLSDGTYTEIKTGLEPGERYVARGAFSLKAELVTSGLDPHAGHGH